MLRALLLLLCAAAFAQNDIGPWADELGAELFRLATSVTKPDELRRNYTFFNARVQQKDGETLVQEIVNNVRRMLKSKMKAVKCIVQEAERLNICQNETLIDFMNHSYYSAKHSMTNGDNSSEKYIDSPMYRPMSLYPSKHFSNIEVNTNYSSVHVPTNVFDKALNLNVSIQWSEGLDRIFIKNAERDPSLSWQYFGSSTGFLRIYPAMEWITSPDVFDCRSRSWYIEASTCSKDVVILLDSTGSMTGMRLNIAKLTVQSILDTFSNNDYVNVFNFSHKAQELVPCFKDMLVQANLENINTFKKALKLVKPDGYANFSQAFIQAFELLEQYREIRGCNDSSVIQCNQAVMLITDSVVSNITEVFDAYNRLNNGSVTPVRVFTYLMGKEVYKVQEIIWMACLNRGSFVHIHSLNEVHEQVFKYIPVVARPLVLQEDIHPIIWTHAYADIKDPKLEQCLWKVMENEDQREKLAKHFRNKELYFSQREEDNVYAQSVFQNYWEPDELRYQEYQLITSVAMPAFDKRYLCENITGNNTFIPDLLGIAGTDVPLADIEKLMMPYKIGVNGYAFIITQNGYILLHPDLRPVSNGYLKDNYNSIDLTEIELLDDGRGPRELNPDILKLREEMVLHKTGTLKGLRAKVHYDDMRRVSSELRDYFYAPLKGTPFSVGISLPQGYGHHIMKVGNMIKHAQINKLNITAFLENNNWRIHPKWMYCKSFNEEEFGELTPENFTRHILRIILEGKRWEELFPKEDEDLDDLEDGGYNSTKPINCEEGRSNEGIFFCDPDLIQLLLFDIKFTDSSYKNTVWTFGNEIEASLLNSYNISLRFIATHSGLTRWQYVAQDEEMLNPSDNDHSSSEFGDLYPHAIEEPWYKSAVIQHKIEPNSFVFSVPYNASTKENFSVIATQAIFPKDGGQTAPAAVVGFQFDHSSLFETFLRITSKPNCKSCTLTCMSDELDCYILDHNAYIVLSENINDTGHFFGEIEGPVMDSMLKLNVFRKIHMFDYQAICLPENGDDDDENAGSFLLTPLHFMKGIIQLIVSRIIWLFLEINLNHMWHDYWVYGLSVSDGSSEFFDYDSAEIGDISEETPSFEEPTVIAPTNKTEIKFKFESCDQKTNLYLLQQETLSKDDENVPQSDDICSRPFHYKKIPKSNLLLVVINSMYQTCDKRVNFVPKKLNYNFTKVYHACHKLYLNDMPRRPLMHCFTEHPEEDGYFVCASGYSITSNGMMLSSTLLLLLRKYVYL